MTRQRARTAPAVAALILACLVVSSIVYLAEPQKTTRPLPPRTYRLVWHDEFDGLAASAPNSAHWKVDSGGNGWGNRELQYYTSRSSNLRLDGAGHLVITAQRESYTGPDGVTRDYTSSQIETLGRKQFEYGRIQAGIRVPEGQGLWPAFWAIGSDFPRVGWPNSGELDLMENLGSDPFKVYGVMHGPSATNRSGYNHIASTQSPTSLAAGYHVYGIDWSPGKIVFTLDGVPYSTRTPSDLGRGERWVFDQPFSLILGLAVGGNFPRAPDSSTVFPATMLVDWVRVYR